MMCDVMERDGILSSKPDREEAAGAGHPIHFPSGLKFAAYVRKRNVIQDGKTLGRSWER